VPADSAAVLIGLGGLADFAAARAGFAAVVAKAPAPAGPGPTEAPLQVANC